jgi:hypothetical protein
MLHFTYFVHFKLNVLARDVGAVPKWLLLVGAVGESAKVRPMSPPSGVNYMKQFGPKRIREFTFIIMAKFYPKTIVKIYTANFLILPPFWLYLHT